MLSGTRALLHTGFAALLTRAGVSQAAFDRTAGRRKHPPGEQLGPRPHCRAVLGGPASRRSERYHARGAAPDAGRHQLSRRRALGGPYGADLATIRQAMRGLALLYHPDKEGQAEQMVIGNPAHMEAAPAASRQSQQTK